MDKLAALDILRANEAALGRRGVVHAALFGSIACGEARDDGDLDVTFEIDASVVGGLFGYVGLCHFIDDLFPIRFDVAVRAALKERVCTHAERDAIPAF
ncbi:MAG: nucleotidyltransferase domain-containing protein [Parafilimonas terrae]|nr:nucleotidyltransferase domain-containing protein [Parafilimonas terrae]